MSVRSDSAAIRITRKGCFSHKCFFLYYTTRTAMAGITQDDIIFLNQSKNRSFDWDKAWFNMVILFSLQKYIFNSQISDLRLAPFSLLLFSFFLALFFLAFSLLFFLSWTTLLCYLYFIIVSS